MKFRVLLGAVLPIVLSGCVKNGKGGESDLTAGQAQSALDEASVASQAQSLSASAVEITTQFTIGQAVENAADELRAFVVSQLPCADATLSGNTVQFVYGAKAGNCTYRGHTFSGESSVTVTRNDVGNVVVNHTWTNLSNGRVELNGSAEVTWSAANKSRHVVYTATFKRLSDGRQGTGSGDVTQSVLEGGLVEGISVNGSRSWQGARGTWDLAIDGIEMRWVDPVPQAGSYTLGTPYGKSVTLSFQRVDADTITVKVESGRVKFSFDVTSQGAIHQSS